MSQKKYQISGSCEIINGSLFINGKESYHCSETSIESTIYELVKEFKVIHPRFGKMDRLSQLGYATIEILLNNFPLLNYQDTEVGILLSNHASSLDTDFNYQASTKQIPSPGLFVYTLPNIVMAEVCIKHKFKGENLFFISDSFNSLEMFRLITHMLDNNKAKTCITGWVEVMGQNYHSVVFTVEKYSASENINEFTLKNIENLFIR